MPIQRAGQGQAQHVDRGVVVPAPGGQRQGEAEIAGQVVVIGVAHRFGGDAGVQVDRQVEASGRRQDRIEARIVEEAAVGRAVHQHAVEAELRDGAVQFIGGGLGCQQRQMGEAAQPGRVACAALGQRVVVGAGEVDAGLAGHQVGAGAGNRQHLRRDAMRVHVRDAGVAEIGEFVALGGLCPGEVRSGEAAAGDGIAGDAGDDARGR